MRDEAAYAIFHPTHSTTGQQARELLNKDDERYGSLPVMYEHLHSA